MVIAINGVVSSRNTTLTNVREKSVQNFSKGQTASVSSFPSNYTSTSLVNAYKAYYGIPLAKTVSFGKSLEDSFRNNIEILESCKDKKNPGKAEKVAGKVSVNRIVEALFDDGNLSHANNSVKADVNYPYTKKGEVEESSPIEMQLVKKPDGTLMFEIVDSPLTSQKIQAKMDKGVPEEAYTLNTKGKMVAIVKDNNGMDMLITNAGRVLKSKGEGGRLEVIAEQINSDGTRNDYMPFIVEDIPEVMQRTPGVSTGGGTELIIGMENGRFVPENIAETQSFIDRIESGEIVLQPFEAAPNAEKLMLTILAAGYGSRSEYANAASEKIFDGNDDGSDCTKGTFRTATGLTPMETTFVTLHNAGLLDCSKGHLAIGKNIKFYLNRSGVNRGNGGFTVDLYDVMKAQDSNNKDKKAVVILANDALSRMTKATIKMYELASSGQAAIAMIAKEVPANIARGKFGIMKLDENNRILEFAEKPKVIPEGYADKNGNCLTNTFQFAISKEAFEALQLIEPFFPQDVKNKESRDWSKAYIPIIMTLTQNDDIDKMALLFAGKAPGQKENDPVIALKLRTTAPDFKEALRTAKGILGDQQVYAIPTGEPWTDCGSLNEYYKVVMDIASGAFKLEDFERAHVLESVDTRSGLIASSPEQLKRIQEKYQTAGQVMAVERAPKFDPSIVQDYIDAGLVAINEPKK